MRETKIAFCFRGAIRSILTEGTGGTTEAKVGTVAKLFDLISTAGVPYLDPIFTGAPQFGSALQA